MTAERMRISAFNVSQSEDVINLFTSVFADAEGQDEGASIGRLVSDLIATTDERDLMGFIATLEDEIFGCIFFSRILLANKQTAFILSPAAVATQQQGNGIGQALIRFGIEHLKSKGVDLLFTYGDPAFYSKSGFVQISEDVVQAPLKLSQPEGWLAQSLQNSSIDPVSGPSQCVAALNNQEYW